MIPNNDYDMVAVGRGTRTSRLATHCSIGLAVLCMCACVTVKTVFAQNNAAVESALSDLSEGRRIDGEFKVLSENKALDSAYQKWKIKASEKRSSDLSEELSAASAAADLHVTIRFQTLLPGAVVKYKYVHSAATTVACASTACDSQPLLAGMITYWAERNGVETSERQSRWIGSDDVIDIVERNP